MKRLYVVTHGIAETDKPDPSLTAKGALGMENVKKIIRVERFDLIIVGIGRRHIQTFEFLFAWRCGVKPGIEKSELVGVREAISSDRKTMIFSDGRKMTVEGYARTIYPKLQRELSSLIRLILKRKGEKTLIIGGRIVPHTLGIENLTSGALYVFNKKLELEKLLVKGVSYLNR